MIEIIRKDAQVILVVDVAPINGYRFSFSFNAGSEWAAIALHKILSEYFRETIQKMRSTEYEQGLKDARKKKDERKSWFKPWIDGKA